MTNNAPLFMYFKSSLKYSEPINNIKVIKPIQHSPSTETDSTDVDTFESFVLSVGKEFIIINLSDFFPIPELLNRCINYDMNHISLTNILNVLYSIDYWLSIPSTYVFLHCIPNSFDSQLIMACYFLWKYTGDLASIAYQDVLLDFIRSERESITIDMIPHSILSVLHCFYCILCDSVHSLELDKVLELRNCQIMGLFQSDHSSFSKIPVVVIGKGNKILFSSKSDQDSVIWNPQIGELIIICTVQIQGDFYISCFANDSDIGCNPPLFYYCSHTAFMSDNVNEIVSSQIDINPVIDDQTLTMMLVSSKEITTSIAVPSTFELLSPSTCSLKGLRQLVSHHALQLAGDKKKILERIMDEEERLLIHFLLLIFDGDWSHADAFVTQMKQERDEVANVVSSDQPSSQNNTEMSTASEVTHETAPDPVPSRPKETSGVDDIPMQSVSEIHNESVSLGQSPEPPCESVLPIEPPSETCNQSSLPTESSEVPNESVISTTTPESQSHPLPSEEPNESLSKPRIESTPSSPNNNPIVPSTLPQQSPSSPRRTVVKKGTPMRGRKGVFLRYHPDYREFFDWWLDDGISKEAVETSMRSEGYDSTVLSRNVREIVAVDDVNFVFMIDLESPLNDSSFSFVKRRNHPNYAKYYNKIDLGCCSVNEVKELMKKDGFDPSVLELDRNEWISL